MEIKQLEVLMQKPENKFKDKFCKEINGWNPGSVLIKHNDPSNIGLPDLQYIYNSGSLFLEVKYVEKSIEQLGKGKVLSHEVTPKQWLFSKKTAMNGIDVFLIVGFKCGRFFMDYLKNYREGNFTKDKLDQVVLYDINDEIDCMHFFKDMLL